MKFRLSKRLLAAVMAAVASVSFNSAGTATLGAAAFTFTVQQAAAEETVASSTEETAIEFSDEDELLASLNEALGEKENEEEDAGENSEEDAGEEESELEPKSAIEVGFNGLYGNSDSFDRQVGSATAADSAPVQTGSVQAAPAATATGTLPSNDLGFTTDVNGSTAASLAKAAVASPATVLMSAAPAADDVQTNLDHEETTEAAAAAQQGHSIAQPSYNGYYNGIYNGLPVSPLAESVASPVLLGAASPQTLIWDNKDNNNQWDTSSHNWHVSGAAEGSSTFSSSDNVTFDNGTATATLTADTTAGAMVVMNGADVTVAGSSSLTLSALTLAGNRTSASFEGHVTVGGTTNIDVAYTTTKLHATAEFNKGVTYTGSGNSKGYGMLIGATNTVVLGGESDFNGKILGMAEGGTLELLEEATASVGSVYNSVTTTNNGKLVLGKDSEFSITNTSANNSLTDIENNGGVLNVASALTVYSTLTGDADGAIVYTGQGGKTLSLNGSVAGYEGSLINFSTSDVAVSLGTAANIVSMNIASWDTGKVNLSLLGADYTFGGSVAVKNITQPVTSTILVANTGSVTADGSVQTGRLVVGPAAGDTGARFTLSGEHAMLSKGADLHTYNGAVQGYGTFTVESGATQALTGDLSAYYGDFVSTGLNSVLTLNSGNIRSDADLFARNYGTLVLGENVSTLGNVTTEGFSTLALSKMGDQGAITLGSLNLSDKTVLDLSALNLTGEETGDIVLAHGGTISGNLANLEVNFGTEISSYALTAKNGNLVINFENVAQDLVWRDPSGTWTAKNVWYMGEDMENRYTFKNGDNVTIEAPYNEVNIKMFNDANATNMTVKNAEGQLFTQVNIANDSGDYKLGVRDLVLETATSLQTDTNVEVTGTVTMEDMAFWTINSPSDSTISADISSEDAPGMTIIEKKGDATLTLTGDNSGYHGSMTVSEGTLVAKSENALGAADVSVADGATLSLENRTGMNAGTLTLGDGSTIAFVGDSWLNVNSLTLEDGTVTWDLSRFGFKDGDSDILMHVDSMDGVSWLQSANIITPGYIKDGASLSYDDQAKTLILTYQMEELRDLYWKGGYGEWTTNTDVLDWYPSETTDTPTAFHEYDSVIFDGRSSSSYVVLSDDTITATNVSVNKGTEVVLGSDSDNTTLVARQINVDGTLRSRVNVEADTVVISDTGTWSVDGETDKVFAGQITGSADNGDGTLAKIGYGDLKLTGDNSGFHGDIRIEAGSVTVGNESALGTDSAIHMENGTIIKADGATTLQMGGNTLSVDADSAAAMVEANMNVAGGSNITFDGNGRLAVTGAISGEGNLVKNGFSTVEILGNATYEGDTTVNAGTLAFANGFASGNDFTVEIGGGLKLGQQAQGQGDYVTYRDGKKVDKSTINFVTGGTLTLKDGVYLDLANVHLENGVAGVAKFGSLDAVMADEIGDTNDPYYYYFIEGVSLLNVEGTGGTTYARLVYADGTHDDTPKDSSDSLLYVQTFGGTNGAYWKGNADTGEGLWFRGDTAGKNSQWRTTQNGNVQATYNWGGKVPVSAYFFELTDSEGYTIDETTVTIASSMPGEGNDGNHPSYGAGDVIIDGNTKYVFEGRWDDERGEDSYLNLNGQYPVALILRSGAQADFKTGIVAQNGSLWQVEEGAAMTIDTSSRLSTYAHESAADYVQLYNVINDGTMDMYVGSTWFKHVVNNGEMSLTAYEDIYGAYEKNLGGSIYVTTIYNAQDATLTLAGEAVTADSTSAYLGIDNDIKNDGLLVFNGTDRTDSESNQFVITVPVVGTGVVRTGEEEGSDAEVLFSTWRTVTVYEEEEIYGYEMGSSTVENSALELGANITTFEEGVNITDSTTVYSGKRANFYGGGIDGTTALVGDITLEAGGAGANTQMVFGPKDVYELSEVAAAYVVTDYTATSYKAGQVVAGVNSTLTVQNGATVDADGYNAGSFTPAGEIEVGTIHGEATGVDAAMLTIHGDTAVDTVTMHDGGLLVEGNASINRIMQDGGTITLMQDSTLNGVNDGGKHGKQQYDLTGGTVTGGTLKLGENVTLTQDAVVDVRTGAGDGTYTVKGDPTSKIDASHLTLEVDRATTHYREVIANKSEISEYETYTQSGFQSSGDEFVQLFDIVYTGEGDDRHNVTHLISGGEAIYHSQASGMMTLVGDDNYYLIQSILPEDTTYQMKDYIGYGYLHTSALGLQTYFVRDNYTSDDRVKLSQIIEASKEDDVPQLNNVVFDITAHNEDYTDYSGTLTVDANRDGDYTKADLFSVTPEAAAAINLNATDASGKEVVLLADENYQGVQGKLDLEGDGVYEINNRNDLGQNVSVRDDAVTPGGEWDGTVRVTGTSTDLYIDNMYAGQGADASTIEFNHWNGALDEGDHTVDAQVLLTGTGSSTGDTAAMTLTGTAGIDYTFTNTVTGNKAVVSHKGTGDAALTFQGDTSRWDGRYQQDTNTNDSLTFSGGSVVNAGVTESAGTMALTYDNTVTEVNGNVLVYSTAGTSSMDITYNGTSPMTVNSGIATDGRSDLAITVGDGENGADVTFTGSFTNTEDTTMTVKEGSVATIDTDATLLRVVGEKDSRVNVETGRTLELTSKDPADSYFQVSNLNNDGTIRMQANGGDIKLHDDTANGNTYEMGKLVLVDPAGTAAIETSGVAGKTTTVNIDNLTGPNNNRQELGLMNENGQGTVNYNLDGSSNYTGTIKFGSETSTGDANVVLNSNNVAARSVLESTGDSNGNADVVVNTGNAQVLGIDSSDDSTVGGTVYGTEGSQKKLTITGDGEYSYNGGLGGNLDIAYTGNGKQTFEGGATGFNGDVTVDNNDAAQGILEILNASSVKITDLTIGANDKLDVGTGTATASGSVVAKGGPTKEGIGSASKLNGNLTLGENASYNVSAAGGTGGLDLGGELTISEGATLSADDIAKIYNMEIGEMYDLAFDVTTFNGVATASGFNDDGTTFGSPIDASTLFGGNQFWEGEYYVCFSGAGLNGGNGSNVGTVYLYKATPEPTTGTLSLLALAALAARRRRRK